MVNVETLHRMAARVLPEVIKTSGVLLEDVEQNELAAMLFPLRRKSTGAVLFRISEETLKAMGDQTAGLSQGGDTGQGRPWSSKRSVSCIENGATAQIPAQLERAMMPESHLDRRIPSVRVYFTTKTDGKAIVVVVPDACVAAYVWRD